jgi:hypothetical protein
MDEHSAHPEVDVEAPPGQPYPTAEEVLAKPPVSVYERLAARGKVKAQQTFHYDLPAPQVLSFFDGAYARRAVLLAGSLPILFMVCIFVIHIFRQRLVLYYRTPFLPGYLRSPSSWRRRSTSAMRLCAHAPPPQTRRGKQTAAL